MCFVGVGPNWRKDEAAAGGEVLSSELGQPWHTSETPALVWALPAAAGFPGNTHKRTRQHPLWPGATATINKYLDWFILLTQQGEVSISVHKHYNSETVTTITQGCVLNINRTGYCSREICILRLKKILTGDYVVHPLRGYLEYHHCVIGFVTVWSHLFFYKSGRFRWDRVVVFFLNVCWILLCFIFSWLDLHAGGV